MSQHGDSRESLPRTATISRNNTDPVGVCIFLSSEELRKLSVDPAQTDYVQYSIVQVNSKYMLEITESAIVTTQDSISD